MVTGQRRLFEIDDAHALDDGNEVRQLKIADVTPHKDEGSWCPVSKGDEEPLRPSDDELACEIGSTENRLIQSVPEGAGHVTLDTGSLSVLSVNVSEGSVEPSLEVVFERNIQLPEVTFGESLRAIWDANMDEDEHEALPSERIRDPLPMSKNTSFLNENSTLKHTPKFRRGLLLRVQQTGSGVGDRLGKVGKDFFRRLTRSDSSNAQELIPDEIYSFTVINLPLVNQTRTTRIASNLALSQDKTEYWMPALPWRCIEQVTFFHLHANIANQYDSYLNMNGSTVGLYQNAGSIRDVKHWQRRFDTETRHQPVRSAGPARRQHRRLNVQGLAAGTTR